jgi:hypothetical protein
MIEVEFVELMQDLVTVAKVTGNDRYGNRTFAPLVTYIARVQAEVQEIRDVEGNVAISSATVYAVPTTPSNPGVYGAVFRGGQWWLVTPFTAANTPGPQDQITLPDGTKPLILRVSTETDETGPHHLVIFS